jgi:hypothetical protein
VIAAASYSVFNGEEHLLHSLRLLRQSVEYLNLVVQFTSNAGLPASPALDDVLNAATRERLVDDFLFFTPDLSLHPGENERRKRQRGLDRAKQRGATHFMTVDCDEYYPPAEFAEARRQIELHDYAATAVRTYLHIQRPIWRSREPDTTCCAFLTRIDGSSQLGGDYPVLADPTRRLHGGAQPFHLFAPEVVSMRHMNLVRRDLEDKLRNSTNAALTDFMAKVRQACGTWRFGEPLRFPNKPPLEIIEVPDLFGIDAEWR